MDCKASVRVGEYCRGGNTRGDNKANDHDRGHKEQSTPFGGVNENTAELHLTFGRSAKTRDFIVDCLYSWWERPSPKQRDALSLLQIKGRRTQFVKRMVEFADHIGTRHASSFCTTHRTTANTIGWSVAG